MISLIQRVSSASVMIDGKTTANISAGMLVFLAVQPDDSPTITSRLAEKVVNFRIFADERDRMNRSLIDTGLSLLVVPQFTLAADTRSGTRPSFTGAAPPHVGKDFFERFLDACRQKLGHVESGTFGANMAVSLVNDGPVTFWLEA